MSAKHDAFRDEQILGAGDTKHVCCGCGGLCDSKEPCPMTYNCACKRMVATRGMPVSQAQRDKFREVEWQDAKTGELTVMVPRTNYDAVLAENVRLRAELRRLTNPCPACDGSGTETVYLECERCHGDGYVS